MLGRPEIEDREVRSMVKLPGKKTSGVSIAMGVPANGWFIRDNPVNMSRVLSRISMEFAKLLFEF